MKYLCICEIREGLLFNKDSNAFSSDVEISYEGLNFGSSEFSYLCYISKDKVEVCSKFDPSLTFVYNND